MSIFGALGGLLGGIIGNKAADKRQNEMLRWQEAQDNTKIQRLQADAKKAGVHPLAAMGTSLTSPSPVSVGGHTDFAAMGQNVGRAIDATTSSAEKISDYTRTAQALTLDKMKLENDLIRTQLVNSAGATIRQPSSPPTFNSREALPPENNPKPEKLDNYSLFGYNFKQDPKFSSAETMENVFGDTALVQVPYAIAKVLNELHAHGIADYSKNFPNAVKAYHKRKNPPASGGW